MAVKTGAKDCPGFSKFCGEVVVFILMEIKLKYALVLKNLFDCVFSLFYSEFSSILFCLPSKISPK